MIMNMVFIHMGTHHKGMIALCQLQRKLPPDLIRFFRRDFAGLEGLPEVVGDHIIRAPVPSGQVQILPLGKKELRIRDPGITLIAINEFSKIRFLRILHIVNNVRNSRRHIPAFSYMQRHQPCSRHTNTSLIQFSRLSFLALVLLWFLCSGLLPSVFIQTVTDRRLFLLGQRILLPCLGEK